MTPLDLSVRLAAALLAGGALGFERQWRRRSAGLRTHVLASLAAATFMIVSAHLVPYQHYGPDEPYITADITRIASHVAVGISFLGAGAILRNNGRTKGLTTAASLWLSTALGLAAGAGMFLLLLFSTVAALFVLVVIRFWERRLPSRPRRTIRLVVGPDGPGRDALMEELGAMADIRQVHFSVSPRRRSLQVKIHASFESHAQLLHALDRLEALPDLRRLSVSQQET